MIKITGCPSLLYVNPAHVESIYIRQEGPQEHIVFLGMASGHQHTIPYEKKEHAEACAANIAGWGRAELTTVEKMEAESWKP